MFQVIFKKLKHLSSLIKKNFKFNKYSLKKL